MLYLTCKRAAGGKDPVEPQRPAQERRNCCTENNNDSITYEIGQEAAANIANLRTIFMKKKRHKKERKKERKNECDSSNHENV